MYRIYYTAAASACSSFAHVFVLIIQSSLFTESRARLPPFPCCTTGSSRVNSDFSYADLGEATGSEAPLQQQQQQPQQKLSGRKRSLPQSCSWDNLSPKAISEMSASLLAGSGWDVGSITNININHTNSNNSPQQPAQITTPACGARDAPAAAASARLCSGNNSHGHPPVAVGATASAAVKPQQQQQAGKNNNNGKAHAGAGYSKGRRGAGAGAAAAGGGAGSAKRLLNPDRMERKASREKRRREEASLHVSWSFSRCPAGIA